MISIIIMTIAGLFTSILSATIGMGGGVVLLSLMTFFMPLNIIIPVHGLVQLVSNTSRTYFLRQHIIWPIFTAFFIGLPFGSLIAIYALKAIQNKDVFLLLIALLIFYTIFKPKKIPEIKIPYWGFSIVGLIVGILGPLIGATGPFIAPFFLRDDLNKKNIVATKASVQILGHLVKIPTFIYIGFDYREESLLIICLILASLVGTKVGVILLHKISDKFFKILFKMALLFAACRILYKVFLF